MVHYLKRPIFSSFMIAINNEEELDSFEVLSGYTAGIVVKKDKFWDADSVDFLVTVKLLGSTHVWSIGIKSKVVQRTINKEK